MEERNRLNRREGGDVAGCSEYINHSSTAWDTEEKTDNGECPRTSRSFKEQNSNNKLASVTEPGMLR